MQEADAEADRNTAQPFTGLAVDSYLFPFGIFVSPRHTRRVVRNTKTAALIEHDHAAVTVKSALQILHGFLRHGIRRAASAYFVGSPLGQNQFHDGLTPSGAGAGSA